MFKGRNDMGLFNTKKTITISKKETHKFSRIIDGKNVIVYSNELLSGQVDFLFNLIENTQKNILQDGWSIYTVTKDNNDFIIKAPDYTKNPLIDTTDAISMSLLVQTQQNDILHQTNMEGQQVSFQDTLTILKDALHAHDFYFERQEVKQGNSGWYLGLLNDDSSLVRTADDYISVYTYQLLELKLQLVKLLSLPVGCLAVIKNNDIYEVVDVDNKKIL
jgi:hypothetical protein